MSKDLSKAFDCIAHDLLIAKLEAQVFTTDALALVFSFLKERNEGVHVNNANIMILKALFYGFSRVHVSVFIFEFIH